jgi:hypothetical protein
MLPLFGCAEKTIEKGGDKEATLTSKFDRNADDIIDRQDWRKMKDEQKKSYTRMSLEEIGENPDAIVSKNKTREDLLREALEKIYSK